MSIAGLPTACIMQALHMRAHSHRRLAGGMHDVVCHPNNMLHADGANTGEPMCSHRRLAGGMHNAVCHPNNLLHTDGANTGTPMCSINLREIITLACTCGEWPACRRHASRACYTCMHARIAGLPAARIMQALHMRAHSHRRLAGGSGALRVVMGLVGATGVGT